MTYQASPQRLNSIPRKLSNDMIFITIAIFIDMLDDPQRDLGKVQLTNHRIANYTKPLVTHQHFQQTNTYPH